jgi:hypothetical protein
VLVYLGVDPVPGLRQGLFAQGTLDTARVTVLSVPLTAVRTDKPEPYVQVVENSMVAHRSVQTGMQGQAQGEWMVAVTGLADRAVAIRGSVGPLRAGTRVKFTAAPAAAASAPAAAASTPKPAG